MPTEPRPITLFEVARRAAQISEPTDADPSVGALLAQFEDADEPSKILRLAARAGKGDPPEPVRDRLADRGVKV
ncbi:MAG: hypothetical protein ACLP50_26690 [Solirubrobacteraceae bacterium]